MDNITLLFTGKPPMINILLFFYPNLGLYPYPLGVDQSYQHITSR